MTRYVRVPKTRCIPQGAVKVTDKLSDAVAYIYGPDSRPCARVFYGKQAKPVIACYYRNPLERALSVKKAFEARQARAGRMVERRTERNQTVNTYTVGDIFRSCWGYEQTNINYYEVIKTTAKTVTVRELQQERDGAPNSGFGGRCVPIPGKFVENANGYRSKAKVCRVGTYGIKVGDCERGYLMTPTEVVPGVKVYDSASWSDGH